MPEFRYTARQLLEVKRWFDENPDGVVRVPVWPNVSYTREEWRGWFLGCLNDKINCDEPNRGRKDCPEWDALVRRTAREVNTPRLIVRWVPFELRSRLGHRLEVS